MVINLIVKQQQVHGILVGVTVNLAICCFMSAELKNQLKLLCPKIRQLVNKIFIMMKKLKSTLSILLTERVLIRRPRIKSSLKYWRITQNSRLKTIFIVKNFLILSKRYYTTLLRLVE